MISHGGLPGFALFSQQARQPLGDATTLSLHPVLWPEDAMRTGPFESPLNMNQVDGDDFRQDGSLNGSDHVGDVGTWNSSSSTATLLGDDVVASSSSSREISESPIALDDTDGGIVHISDSSPASLILLPPAYSGGRQSGYEESLPHVPDLNLAQRPKKVHRKSRQGCFNCKRRKIKCQETLPACDNCIRKELMCRYPPVKVLTLGASTVGSPFVTVQLQTTPIFSLTDMRLFHHFIFHAYPHLPLGNETVWVRRIPAVAYHYQYLMHALLALAAQHLTITAEADYASLALSHRLLAIKGFNEALSKTPRTGSDGDALLATCYALAFQSSYMKDGINEFLTLVRGCGLVQFQLLTDGVDSSFTVTPTKHVEFMESRLDYLPTVDADLYDGAVASFHALGPLCQGDAAHMSFYRVLQECVETLSVDPRSGYFKFVMIYQIISRMTNHQFQVFSQSTNMVTQLLLAHFVAIEIMIGPILGREWKGRMMSAPMEGILGWLKKILREMSPHLVHYLNWPAHVVRSVEAEIQGERAPRPWLTSFFRRRDT